MIPPIPDCEGLSGEELDQLLKEATRQNELSECQICFYLLEVQKRKSYEAFCFQNIYDYAHDRFGIKERKTTYMPSSCDENTERIQEAFGRVCPDTCEPPPKLKGQPDPNPYLAVCERDGWCCSYPGCSARAMLHPHHLELFLAMSLDDLGALGGLSARSASGVEYRWRTAH